MGEALQIILGLVIPLLIIDHVVGTRIRHELSNYYDSYEAIIRGFWITSPFNGVKQTLALIVIWCHGCIGIYFWLRYRDRGVGLGLNLVQEIVQLHRGQVVVTEASGGGACFTMKFAAASIMP